MSATSSQASRVAALFLALLAGTAGIALAADAPAPKSIPAPNPPPAAPASAAAASSPAVQLPPMLVEESVSTVPWLYVNAGGTEFLSRCSAGVTRELVDAWQVQMQLVRVLVPEDFVVQMEVPSVFVLYAQDLEQRVSADIQRELQSSEKGSEGVNIAPSMRLADRDMHASIAYVDEARFDGAGLSVAPAHVRYLLRGRVPELPGWLINGVERTIRHADFVTDPITVRPMVWQNSTESEALGWDATRPRAILPASELFAGDTASAAANHHPLRLAVREGTEELFVRWALLGGRATREAFWKFVSRSAEAPVTEEMFEACFGFEYAELRDRLSDYLPTAVWETKRLDIGTLPRLPRVQVERATPDQIARVRGEWERLAIAHVQRRLPQARGPYIAQARRTLHRAYDAGERDPRLLATMGLCEIDAGNDAGAVPFLEGAVAGRVVRPRAYYELARLRFAELRRNAPEEKKFSVVELMPVIRPLQRGLTQAPPLPEAFALLAEAWARCDGAPEPAEFAELLQGTRMFGRRPGVAVPIARALLRHGKKTEAAVALDGCAAYAQDDPMRDEIARLRAELAKAGK
jgi:hypothetical protein